MFPIRRNVRAFVTMALAVTCGALAVMWPPWRSELRAQSGYIRCERVARAIDLMEGAFEKCIDANLDALGCAEILEAICRVCAVAGRQGCPPPDECNICDD